MAKLSLTSDRQINNLQYLLVLLPDYGNSSAYPMGCRSVPACNIGICGCNKMCKWIKPVFGVRVTKETVPLCISAVTVVFWV